MREMRLIDTDQHVIEPPDFWTSRMGEKWQDVAPRVVDYPRGGQAWSFEGGVWLRPFGLESAAGRAPADLDTWGNSFENMNPSAYNPTARLKDMDVDGVGKAILYPSVAMSASSIQDDELYLECFRTYNDALWEWCQEGDPDRLIPAAIMPAIGVETAMQELERVGKMGYKTYFFNQWPSGDKYPSAADDPFWALCEQTGLVVSMHGAGVGRVQIGVGAMEGDKTPKGTTVKRMSQEHVNDTRASGLHVALPVSMLTLTGVFDRFPNLKVALVETGAGWLPFYAEQLDRAYTHQRWAGGRELDKMPSEYLRTNLRATIQLDGAAISYRHLIGVDRIMFSTDFPHATCDWPNSRQWMHFLLKGVPEAEQQMILYQNAADWYGLN